MARAVSAFLRSRLLAFYKPKNLSPIELSNLKNLFLNDKVAISNETIPYFIKISIIFATDFIKQTK